MSLRQPDPGRTPESDRSPVPLAPLGLSLAATGARYKIDQGTLRRRIERGYLSIVRLGQRRVLVLNGDHQALMGSRSYGLETIAEAGAGRTVLTLREVGVLLGICRKTAENLIAFDGLPSFLDELGRRLVPVREFRAWLRDRRKPTCWERTQRRGAA